MNPYVLSERKKGPCATMEMIHSAGIALQGCGGMVFWAHLFPLLSLFHLLLSKLVLANDLFVSCTKGVGVFKYIFVLFSFLLFADISIEFTYVFGNLLNNICSSLNSTVTIFRPKRLSIPLSFSYIFFFLTSLKYFITDWPHTSVFWKRWPWRS